MHWLLIINITFRELWLSEGWSWVISFIYWTYGVITVELIDFNIWFLLLVSCVFVIIFWF